VTYFERIFKVFTAASLVTDLCCVHKVGGAKVLQICVFESFLQKKKPSTLVVDGFFESDQFF